MELPLWIRTPEELDALAADLEGAGAVAIDTEADSLHHYPGKLCLVQIGDRRGHGHLVDPLALPTLAASAPLLRRSRHAQGAPRRRQRSRLSQAPVRLQLRLALRHRARRALPRRAALGLEGCSPSTSGSTPVKSRQKDDWSRRPLTAEQEAYALDDVLHLVTLRERLLEELVAKGRASGSRRSAPRSPRSSCPRRWSIPTPT